MRRRFLAFCLTLAFLSPAHAWLPHGSASPPITASVSATTIYATWNTGSAGVSSGGCDTSPGSYAKTAIVLDGGGSVTTHQVIIAGLVASTLYYCEGVSGASPVLFQTTTSATPTSTPLISATIGSPTQPLSGQNTGDTFGNATSNDGKTYLTTDDGSGWVGSGAVGTGLPMIMGSLNSSYIGTNVNTLSNFTAHGEPPKLFGVVSYNGVLYSPYSNLCSTTSVLVCSSGGANFFGQMWGGILKSPDHGANWANWQNATSYSAGGTVPSPYNGVTMWDGASGCSQSSFITYGTDNGTVLPTYRVDNADAYAYLICSQPLGDAGTADGMQFNTNSIYLARIEWAALPTLDKTKVRYFTGGDGSLDSAWSSTYSGAAAIATNAGKVSPYSFAHYMPSTGRYVWFDWYWNDLGSYTSSTWLIYEAAHPWGPWTLISTTTYPSGGTAATQAGWYAPAAYMPSALIATANGTPMQLLTAGDFLGNGTCPICAYQLTVIPVVLNTH